MKWKFSRRHVKSGIDLLEEAVYLLRKTPVSVLAFYCIGAFPFILALLYFWADMSRSPFAARHAAEAALGMSLAYIWLKCWQSVFAANLRAALEGSAPPHYDLRRIGRLVLSQWILQPYSLIVLPLCALAVIPFGWVYAYYHNLLITADGSETNLKTASTKAWKQATLWQSQNQGLIFVIALCAVVVCLDVGIIILFVPELIRMFFGMETIFTMSGQGMINTTFWAAAAGITYLFLNPLTIAVYVLRCFYGESLHSAADLKAELKSITAVKTKTEGAQSRIAIFIFAAFIIAVSAQAQESKQSVSPDKLNDSIERVIEKREYQWRIPRDEKDVSEQQNLFLEFLKGVRQTISRWTEPIQEMWTKLRRWFRKLFSQGDDTSMEEPGAASPDQQMLLTLLLLFAVAAVLGVLIYRYYKKRTEDIPLPAAPVAVLPDLNDENVGADQLPEEGWQTLAMELLQRGELRLALRAIYMASLASLASRGLITIARYKSNRDYQREVERRAREAQEVVGAFSENVSVFERIWYGMYDINENIVRQFEANHQRIRNLA